jgi:hypothetical protein
MNPNPPAGSSTACLPLGTSLQQLGGPHKHQTLSSVRTSGLPYPAFPPQCPSSLSGAHFDLVVPPPEELVAAYKDVMRLEVSTLPAENAAMYFEDFYNPRRVEARRVEARKRGNGHSMPDRPDPCDEGVLCHGGQGSGKGPFKASLYNQVMSEAWESLQMGMEDYRWDVHQNVVCDECGGVSSEDRARGFAKRARSGDGPRECIRGTRYKSKAAADYDLCQECYQEQCEKYERKRDETMATVLTTASKEDGHDEAKFMSQFKTDYLPNNPHPESLYHVLPHPPSKPQPPPPENPTSESDRGISLVYDLVFNSPFQNFYTAGLHGLTNPYRGVNFGPARARVEKKLADLRENLDKFDPVNFTFMPVTEIGDALRKDLPETPLDPEIAEYFFRNSIRNGTPYRDSHSVAVAANMLAIQKLKETNAQNGGYLTADHTIAANNGPAQPKEETDKYRFGNSQPPGPGVRALQMEAVDSVVHYTRQLLHAAGETNRVFVDYTSKGTCSEAKEKLGNLTLITPIDYPPGMRQFIPNRWKDHNALPFMLTIVVIAMVSWTVAYYGKDEDPVIDIVTKVVRDTVDWNSVDLYLHATDGVGNEGIKINTQPGGAGYRAVSDSVLNATDVQTILDMVDIGGAGFELFLYAEVSEKMYPAEHDVFERLANEVARNGGDPVEPIYFRVVPHMPVNYLHEPYGKVDGAIENHILFPYVNRSATDAHVGDVQDYEWWDNILNSGRKWIQPCVLMDDFANAALLNKKMFRKYMWRGTEWKARSNNSGNFEYRSSEQFMMLPAFEELVKRGCNFEDAEELGMSVPDAFRGDYFAAFCEGASRLRKEWVGAGYDRYKNITAASTVFLTSNGGDHVGGSVMFSGHANGPYSHETRTKVPHATLIESKAGRVVTASTTPENKRCSFPVVGGIKLSLQVWWGRRKEENGPNK